MHSMIGLGIVGLVSKVLKWDESAMFFDGSSLAAFMFGVCIYLTVTIPGLRAVVVPTVSPEDVADKVEALRVMCAGNVLIAICLLGVLSLQAGQEYALRSYRRELAKAEQEEKEAEAAAKKNS